VNTIGNSIVALLKNNIDLREIHTNHSVKDIVEELIRYDSPLQFFQRWVLEDTEIEGVKVKKHTKVAILLGSANRDARAFEEADEINFNRDTFNHTSFGGGVHYCLGAHLARLELEVSFNNLLCENIELISNPKRTGAFGIRGYQGIKVKI
jgi:cytochrome P450